MKKKATNGYDSGVGYEQDNRCEGIRSWQCRGRKIWPGLSHPRSGCRNLGQVPIAQENFQQRTVGAHLDFLHLPAKSMGGATENYEPSVQRLSNCPVTWSR